jgi:DNA mismatch endonuclease (patch repair protein)
MAEKLSKSARSANMSKIRAKDTKPELLVRKFLHACGFRYRVHVKNLPGKPDITLSRYKTIVFINGCFWHGHENCNRSSLPKTRTQWWTDKIEKNKVNDHHVKEELEDLGWKVIVVWTCRLKPSILPLTLNVLREQILFNVSI